VFSLSDQLEGVAEHLQRYLNCDSVTVVVPGSTYADLHALIARVNSLDSFHLDQLDNSSMSTHHIGLCCWE